MTRLKYPGVRPLGNNRYEIRATWKNPSTGKMKETLRTVIAPNINAASGMRQDLVAELQRSAGHVDRWTVKAYCRWWLERRRDGEGDQGALRRGTLIRYAQHLDSFCNALGGLFMDELTPLHIKRWLADEAKKPSKRTSDGLISGYTLLGMLRAVRTVTKDAQTDLRLPHWACERVKAPKPVSTYTEEEPNALTPGELERLWQSIRMTEPEWFPLFAFMADTGLRFCHAHAMQWDDLDLDAGVYRINRSRYRGEVNPPSKRKSGHHTGILPAELVEVLREHRVVLEASEGPGVRPVLCFPNSVGTYADHRSLSKAIARAARLVGIAKRITPHGCRRTMTTEVVHVAGEAVAQTIVGHATTAMTRRYVAHDLDTKRAAVEAVVQRRVATRSVPAPIVTTIGTQDPDLSFN